VGDLERWASILAGGALAFWGLERRSLGGLVLAVLGGRLMYRGATGHCEVYQALGADTSGRTHGPAASVPAGQGIKVVRTITIRRPPAELYRFWHDFENLPRFMRHLESVRALPGNRSHWVAKAPLGMKVEWDAEIVTDREPEVIGWRSLPGAEVPNAGSVHFRRAPGDRGTEIQVELNYLPPAGAVGAAVSKLFGEEPGRQVQEDLRRLKEMLEAGEVPTTAGQPTGRAAR
jgi:uncharacterized membrane protein